MEIVSEQKCFGGQQLRIKHQSSALNCSMHFSLYLPPHAPKKRIPLLTWLSGLTCTDENFVQKAGAQQYAAKAGIALLAPDTSPRGSQVANTKAEEWSLGKGAGFYLNATQEPWKKHYQMERYITKELQMLMAASSYPLDLDKQGISGHSMGGHGALILGMKNPTLYKSVSALSPLCAPSLSPWGQAALKLYLGENKSAWEEYDACALIKANGYDSDLLVDVGSEDPYLTKELCPEKLKNICRIKNVNIRLRMQEGYDHSYFFVATFIEDHIEFHKQRLFVR